jgi:hypothetical protein
VKTLLTALTATALLATSANAIVIGTGTTTWNGDTNFLLPGCVFEENVSGTMKYDEATTEWATDQAAYVKIKTRNGNATNDPVTNNIKVEPLGKDGTTVVGEVYSTTAGTNLVYSATLNYAATSSAAGTTLDPSSVIGPSHISTNINSNGIQIGNVNQSGGVIQIDIGGTAKLAAGTVIDANTDFRVNHLVTCIQ